MPQALWEKVLCHFDEDGNLLWITRGNGMMQHYRVENIGIEEFGELHGANAVHINSLINNEYEKDHPRG